VQQLIFDEVTSHIKRCGWSATTLQSLAGLRQWMGRFRKIEKPIQHLLYSGAEIVLFTVAIMTFSVQSADAVTFQTDRWDLGTVIIGQQATAGLTIRNPSTAEAIDGYLFLYDPFRFSDGQSRADVYLGQKNPFGKTPEDHFTVVFSPTQVGRFCSWVIMNYKACSWTGGSCDYNDFNNNNGSYETKQAGPFCGTAVHDDDTAVHDDAQTLTPELPAILLLVLD
jgi:hypothetical protein